MDILSYKLGQNSIEPDKPDQSKTANPSTQTQVIRPDAGYELASVTINPVTSSIDENIIPSNIKKDVSILGVLGQLEEGAKGLYKVASIQERDDIENPEEGDICLVYQNEYVELTRDLEFNTFKVPNSFTFDEDMSGEPSRWWGVFFNSVNLMPSTSLDGNTNTGALINANTSLNSPCIEYIANNYVYTLGGSNTAIPETDYTLNSYIKLNSTITDREVRLFKSFIQPHIFNFDGIYIYNNNQWNYLDIDIDTTASQVLQGKKAYTSSGIITGTLEQGQSDIYKTATIQEMNNLDNVEEGDICLVYENSYKPIIPNLNFNVFQFPDSVTLSQAVEQSSAYFEMVDDSEGYVSVGFSIYEGAEIMGYVELDGDFQEFNITYTTSDNITFTKSSATGEGIITGNIVTLPKEIYLSEANNEVGNFIKVEQPEFAGIFQYDGSVWNNLNIGLNGTANDIIAEIKAYSNDGVLTGTLGNTVSSSFNDTACKVYSKAQVYYNTLTPTVAPADSSRLYAFTDLFTIPAKTDGTPLLNTSSATNVSKMFEDCKNLTTIACLDTSNVTTVEGMFSGCSSLKNVPLLNTQNVTNFQSFFAFCTSLTTIPQFNTSNGIYFTQMFNLCNSLTSVPLLNTSRATNVSEMFRNCYTLTSVPLFDFSNVTNMFGTFNGCTNLQTVPLLNTSKVTNMGYMFNDCLNLSDTSLNNILQMCINALSYTGTKTLVRLGFIAENYPASRIQALSNYTAFTNAGWTIGY